MPRIGAVGHDLESLGKARRAETRHGRARHGKVQDITAPRVAL